MEEHESPVKKLKTSIISAHVESNEFQELFAKHWQDSQSVKTQNIEIIVKPYRICKISNFLRDDTFISKLKNQLGDVKTHKNSMDMYQFEQTEDLVNVTESDTISEFYRTFKSDVMNWMEKNTRISLNGRISMSGSKYSDTDYLLCHDDNIGDRRIAFVYYLSENWLPDDGGSLDIFDTDETGQPKDIVKSLVPEYNSLVFFEVVHNSYHQVAEVKSMDKVRTTINGWFYGSLENRKAHQRIELLYKYIEPEDNDVHLLSYVSKIYLLQTIVKEIQQAIEKDSFIYLPEFLLSKIYEQLRDDIKSESVKWKKVGPAVLQNYEIADENTLTKSLKDFCDIFKSIHFFHLLKQYTELDLVPDTSDMKPKMTIELQRWSSGCYTLINVNEINEGTMDIISKETVTKSSKNTQSTSKDHQSTSSEIDNKKFINKTKQPSTSCGEMLELSKESTLSNGPEESDASSDGPYIEDYSSDSQSNADSELSESKPGTLDVLLQFHTDNVQEDVTIDYVDPSQKDGALIHIPPQDNHLCLVYRTAGTSRCNKYVNHYCKGYFYTLVCSYFE